MVQQGHNIGTSITRRHRVRLRVRALILTNMVVGEADA